MRVKDLSRRYQRDGVVFPVDIIDAETAMEHRRRLEQAESSYGSIHYKPKIHAMLTSPYELATLPRVLDLVESILGPNILLYNITYIIKEPKTGARVSWHQDLTYWGFDCDDQVSMWLALSPAAAENGCMRAIPGTHKDGRKEHILTEDRDNLLYSGQTVFNVDEDKAVDCELQPGQASFHHGWTLHSSMPNKSGDRRIGVNVQYLATHVKQTKSEEDSAILVRGVDEYGYYQRDIEAESDLTEAGMARQEVLEARYKMIAGGAS